MKEKDIFADNKIHESCKIDCNFDMGENNTILAGCNFYDGKIADNNHFGENCQFDYDVEIGSNNVFEGEIMADTYFQCGDNNFFAKGFEPVHGFTCGSNCKFNAGFVPAANADYPDYFIGS